MNMILRAVPNIPDDMIEVVEDKFLVNYGWECIWCDPKNIYIKDFIKGPFAKPKLVYSYPFATFCQMKSEPRHYANTSCECSPKPNGMFKKSDAEEDSGAVKVLNRSNNVGQGIPDPWTSYPYAGNSEDLKTEIRSYISELLKEQKNMKKRRCLCCEKKYLFQCPDQTEKSQNCTCQDCHSKNGPVIGCGKDCKCIKILKKWVLENVPSLVEKENGPDNDLGGLKNEDKFPKHGAGLNDQGTNTDTFPTTKYEPDKKNSNEKLIKSLQETHKKTCFCSYLKSFSFRKKKVPKIDKTDAKRNSSPPASKLRKNSTTSKQIQTDVVSKRKVDQSNYNKVEQKCVCEVKQSRHTVPDSDSQTKMLISNICMPHLHVPNTTFLCPFPCDGLKITKHCKHKSCQTKEKDLVEISNHDLLMYQSKDLKGDELLHSRSSPASYDRLKFLTEIKLRNYLQRKELGSGVLKNKINKSLDISPRLSKLYEGNTPFGKIEIERWKPFLENKRLDSAVQTTPRKTTAETTTKVTFLKETVESDESKTYGLVRHCEGSCQSVRRRGKLLGKRKKRKKLAANKSFVVVKPHKKNSTVTANQSNRSRPGSPKRVSFNISKENTTGLIALYGKNSGELSAIKKNSSKRYSEGVGFTMEQIGQEISTRPWTANGCYDGVPKQRDKVGDMFEKTSHNSDTSWSSNTLKSVVDGLLVEKPLALYQKY